MSSVTKLPLTADNLKSNEIARRVQHLDSNDTKIFLEPAAIASSAAGLGVNVLFIDPTTGELKRSTT